MNDDILKEDICNLAQSQILEDLPESASVLITGATGLICSQIIWALACHGVAKQKNIQVLALVRNEKKARSMFGDLIDAGLVTLCVGDIVNPLKIEQNVDFIIHGASATSSLFFVEKPVETIVTALQGTQNMLELAKEKQVDSFVYLSSMEAYGSPTEEQLLTEKSGAYFDSMSVRSCYPESKRMCESLCAAYTAEYGVPGKVVRLSQTFGPGVSKDDVRVFADFARKAVNGEDIVMQTKGDSCRMYLYTMDAVAAILTVLLKGKNGECYNAANKETYCSIKEMAELVSATLSGGKSKVTMQIDEENIKKYPPAHKLKLDTARLESLNWQPERGLRDMFIRLAESMSKECI